MDQERAAEDIVRYRDVLSELLNDGTVVFAVCAGFQLLGNFYETTRGRVVQGAGLIDTCTVAADTRISGYVAVQPTIDNVRTMLGFENHCGRTYFAGERAPLGRVLFGAGNNGDDGTEGYCANGVIGTYLHGPVLPANPTLADYLLKQSYKPLMNRDIDLLDDCHEESVREVMLTRARRRTTMLKPR